MLVPLYILAMGALLAGLVFHTAFIGSHHEVGISIRTIWISGRTRSSSVLTTRFWKLPQCAEAGEMGAFHHDGAWFFRAWVFYIRSPGHAGRTGTAASGTLQVPAQQVVFRRALRLGFVRPAKWLGRFLWKQGDGRVIDGLGPDGISARVLDVTRGVVKLQSGYLYHYAFAMLIGAAALITWMMFGGSSKPWPTSNSFDCDVPAAGRRADHFPDLGGQ